MDQGKKVFTAKKGFLGHGVGTNKRIVESQNSIMQIVIVENSVEKIENYRFFAY